MPDKTLRQQLARRITNRDIFHDLMQFRVRNILLVSTIYDAFIIEKEGQVSEQIFGEYFQMNISHAPRITHVTSSREALEKVRKKSYDLVIIMMGADKQTPLTLSKELKTRNKKQPVLILLNNNSDIHLFQSESEENPYIDKVFVWNGDSRIFLAMVKYIEDKINVRKDTKIGAVRVILLVEDSIRYYSRYLPTLYTVLMKQTQRLVKEEGDEFKKLLQMRGRPKVLMVSSYEEAIKLFSKYQEYMLCVISDVKYKRKGVICENAGVKLVNYLKKRNKTLPTLLQSSRESNAMKAFQLESRFIHKNSETLQFDLKSFFIDDLGFGDFIFRDQYQNQLAKARSIDQFEDIINHIPNESIFYHGLRNHFSTWMIARGQIRIAKELRAISVLDFEDVGEVKRKIIGLIERARYERQKGEIIPFQDARVRENTHITKLSSGSFGGKGRGIGFTSHLIENFDFEKQIANIDIKIPRTAVIGTDEFDHFMEQNQIYEALQFDLKYKKIKHIFLSGSLSNELIARLRTYLEKINTPLAVRSSGLFEDSLHHPFAGIYDTFLLPNNNKNTEVRLQQLTKTIKLIYASIFSPSARTYFGAINYKIEEEKMAIILQSVVGEQFGDYFYPHISGVAQSYNYYPFSYIKPQDGLSVLAIGLGKHVVEGKKAFRFSPAYPQLDMISNQQQMTATQREFYAINMNVKRIMLTQSEMSTLTTLPIEEIRKNPALFHCASTFDYRNGRLIPGLGSPGPIIVNFANILKYDHIPLAATIKKILEIFEYALGSPVEIEFSVDLNGDPGKCPAFYILQIKPLIQGNQLFNIDLNQINHDHLILYTEKGMGNGENNELYDVIYVDPDHFDKSKTLDMAQEIEAYNQYFREQNKKYVLVGPGRWGSSDRWLGIPVVWGQISQAQIIVETSLPGYAPDASFGSHFFHNITSMNVGYFVVSHNSKIDFIRWDSLRDGTLIQEGKYLNHVQFSHSLKILMDGKKGTALIGFHNCMEDNSENI